MEKLVRRSPVSDITTKHPKSFETSMCTTAQKKEAVEHQDQRVKKTVSATTACTQISSTPLKRAWQERQTVLLTTSHLARTVHEPLHSSSVPYLPSHFARERRMSVFLGSFIKHLYQRRLWTQNTHVMAMELAGWLVITRAFLPGNHDKP